MMGAIRLSKDERGWLVGRSPRDGVRLLDNDQARVCTKRRVAWGERERISKSGRWRLIMGLA